MPAVSRALLAARSGSRFRPVEINLTAGILRITLDPEADWDHTEGRGDEVLVDYDDDGLPIAVELFGSAASKPLNQLVGLIDRCVGEEGAAGVRTVLSRVLGPNGMTISGEGEAPESGTMAGMVPLGDSDLGELDEPGVEMEESARRTVGA